jgi:DNA-directed RNA polymerase subunit RPC12/RpoP
MSIVEVSCKTCWFDFTVWDEQEGRITHCPNCGSRIVLEAGRFPSMESFLPDEPVLAGPARSPSGDVRRYT